MKTQIFQPFMGIINLRQELKTKYEKLVENLGQASVLHNQEDVAQIKDLNAKLSGMPQMLTPALKTQVSSQEEKNKVLSLH